MKQHLGALALLVAVQVGVCVVLLLGSALFTRSAIASLTHDTGLHTNQGAQVSVDLDLHKFDELAGRRYQARALQSVRAIGGVTQAALYDRLQRACAPLQEQFYDRENSWYTAMRRAIERHMPRRGAAGGDRADGVTA